MKMVDTQRKTKLNIGSGKSYIQGFLNVDVNPRFNPDIVVDITEVSFPSESFKSVMAHDVLDHVTHYKLRRLLRFILRWLKPNGELSITLPNLDYLVKILYKTENPRMRHEALKWMYGTDGKGNTNYETNVIRWCYNKKAFVEMLEYIGFDVIDVRFDCNGFRMIIMARKPK